MFTHIKQLLARQAPAKQTRKPEVNPVKILHIDSSILGPYSVSRVLSADIVKRQVAAHPNATVIYRDLASEPTLHLSPAHMAVFQGGAPADETLGADLATGGSLIDELIAADIVVIGAPMYNFSVPSQLKAWIDRVCVAGRTFQYGANGPEGLLAASKKVFIASSRGGVYTGDSPAAALEHHESYLRSVLTLIGLTDVTVIRAEGVNLSEEAKAAAVAKAKAEIAAL
jgi:FMN-dependent NADH-azoreductase